MTKFDISPPYRHLLLIPAANAAADATPAAAVAIAAAVIAL